MKDEHAKAIVEELKTINKVLGWICSLITIAVTLYGIKFVINM